MAHQTEKKKILDLLQLQLTQLDDPSFELSSWKSSAIVLLQRILGNQDPRVLALEKINYDYSSWTLRDTTGKGTITDPAKKMGRDIITNIIAEIETKDNVIIDPAGASRGRNEQIREAMEAILTVKQIREIEEILKTVNNKEESMIRLRGVVASLRHEVLTDLIAELILATAKD
jgi:hypothetical protein